jgi:predicted porin
MRKIIASASLAALGAVSMQAAYAPGLSPLEQSKPWSVGLAVRGFYDDNYTTSPSSAARDSWGVSVNPSVGLHKAFDQTLIALSYSYEMRWFEDREQNEADHIQTIKLRLEHAFNERYRLKVTDTFYYGQEGSVELGPVTAPTVLETDRDYWRNTARVGLEADVTEQFGMMVAYQNQIWDYEQKGFNSRSALLDRMEHLGTIEGLWHFRPETSGLLGYQYQQVDHRGSGDILFEGVPVDNEIRDLRSHRAYVGVQHKPTSDVDLGIRLGAEFADYHNTDEDSVSPFVDARGTWTYNPGSFVQVGVVHTLNQTDVGALSQESTAVWGMINHRITPRLTGSVLGQFQYSEFQEGAFDGDSDLLWLAGVNLHYKFNPYLGVEAGYNYDKLDSDLSNRSYSRNRVYLGVRANY